MTKTRILCLVRFAALLAAALFFSPSAWGALVTLKASDASGSTSFNTAGNWSNAQAPAGTNDYSTAGFMLRTPADGSNHIFLGNSLTLAGSGTNTGDAMLTKQKGTPPVVLTFTNLILTNLAVIQDGPDQPPSIPNIIFAGNMTLTNGGGCLWPANGNIIVQSTMAGSGPLYIGSLATSSQAAQLSSNVVFAGNIGGYKGAILSNPDTATTTASGGQVEILMFSLTNNQVFGGAINTGPLHPVVVNQPGIKVALTATNTYNGPTTISAGTLALSGFGSIANTPLITLNAGATLDVSALAAGFTLEPGQTLAGNGMVVGGMTNNGTISPGNAAVGTLSISNNLTLAGATVMKLDRTAAPTNDAVAGVGTLTYGGTLTLNLIGGTLVTGDTFTLFKAGGYSGAFSQIIAPAGVVFDISSLAVNGSIRVINNTNPPSFSGPIWPPSTTIQTGQSVTFTNAVDGALPISCQWIFNGTNIPKATALTLTLTNLQVADSGSYSLVASNAYGMATNLSPAALVVTNNTTPPGFVGAISSTATALFAGGAATLTGTVTGAQPMTYQWLFNGAMITNANELTLALTNLQAGSSGSYTLVASNAYGMATNSFPVALTVVSLNLNCAVTGSVARVSWNSLSGYQYQLLTATNLAGKPNNWSNYGSPIQGTGGLSGVIITPTNCPGRYFSFMATPMNTVVSYPMPSCYSASSQLSLMANSSSVPVLDCSTQFVNYDYCEFSFSGTVAITITAGQNITSYSISPLKLGIPGSVNGSNLTFSLTSPQYLIVQINSLRTLVIAADALESSIPPVLGSGIYNVTNSPYNADPTGATMATTAIQNAVNDATAAGGGIVYVPPGVFLCGNLVLDSDVSLYLAGGSVIRGTGNPSDYVTRFYKSSIAENGTWFICTATNSSNVKIYGRGTIDGNGHYMRNTRDYLNNLVVPLTCSYFTLDGVILRDSGLWAFIPTRSDHVVIRNSKHFNNNEGDTEDDAMDINECQGVTVSNSIAVSEDDTYSVKTWTNYPSTDIAEYWPGNPEVATNVVFDNCVAWSRCGAFKIGNGCYETQADITFRNSSVYRCWYAVAVLPAYGIAPAINITYTNIDVEGFSPRSGSGYWLNSALVDNTVTNLVVANVNIRNADGQGSILKGTSASIPFAGVHFINDTYLGVPGTNFNSLNITSTNSYLNNVTFQ